MAEQSKSLAAFTGDPVELNNPTGAGVLFVAVEAVLAAFEGDKGAILGRDFHKNIIDICGAEQAQSAARVAPVGVHIDQDGDDLAFGIGVNFSIVIGTSAANGDGG